MVFLKLARNNKIYCLKKNQLGKNLFTILLLYKPIK
jgi:hypothetical protein